MLNHHATALCSLRRITPTPASASPPATTISASHSHLSPEPQHPIHHREHRPQTQNRLQIPRYPQLCPGPRRSIRKNRRMIGRKLRHTNMICHPSRDRKIAVGAEHRMVMRWLGIALAIDSRKRLRRRESCMSAQRSPIGSRLNFYLLPFTFYLPFNF